MKTIENLIENYGYSSLDVYAEKFMQYPIFLDRNDQYKKMKVSTKHVYMYLKDRNKYSLKNNKIDNDGKIFIIFEIKELSQKICLSKNTVLSAIKELEGNKLLIRKNNGYNRNKKKQNPNFYYLLKPVLSQEDVYEKEEFAVHNLDSASNGDFKQRSESKVSDISIYPSTLDKKKQGSESRTHLYHYLSKDIKDIKETSNDINKYFELSLENTNKELDKHLITSFIKDNNLEELYGENIVNCLSLISSGDIKIFNDWYNKFVHAIKSAEREKGYSLELSYIISNNYNFVEHVRDSLATKLRTCITKIKTDHRIKDPASYTFSIIKKTAISLLEQQKKI